MTSRRIPWTMILILAVGTTWTTVGAVGHETPLMWPVAVWLWLSLLVALRSGARRRHHG